jgi:hypothetical protein
LPDITDDREFSGKSLLSELHDTYNVDCPNGAAFLHYLRSVGLLVRLERWKFAHDTFEEFFLRGLFGKQRETQRKAPESLDMEESCREFTEVFTFLYELLAADALPLFAQDDLPDSWRKSMSEGIAKDAMM